MKFKWTEDRKEIIVDLLVIAVAISAVVLIAYKMNGLCPFGGESLARADMVQQTIPAEMYYVWDVLHGQASPFFTWNSGFGMNLSGAASLGALLCPMNLLLYLSPRGQLVYYVNIFVMLKMICIAFAMYFYLRKYKVKNAVRIAGGILYAFGAAVLVHFQIMLVMDAAFFLPLVMIGADRIFDKKGCKFFILMLALCMAVNVYTGGMTLIFVFLFCGSRIFLAMDDLQERRRCSLWLGVSVGVAVLLSAVVTVPALLSISNTSRQSTGDLLSTYLTAIGSKWSLGEWKTVERMLVNLALPGACIAYYLSRGGYEAGERRKRYRGYVCVGVLMLCSVLVEGIELLWHGGSRAMWPVRFVFIITFVAIDFAVLLVRDHAEKEKGTEEVGGARGKCVLCAAAAGAALLSGIIFSALYDAYCQKDAYASLQDGFLCILIELCFAAAYWKLLQSRRRAFLLALLCAELTCTSIVSFAPNKDNVATFAAEHLEAANSAGVSLDVEVGDFERFKNMDYKIDEMHYPLVMGVEAISNYWHVISPSLQPAFAALGYTINWTQMLDTGGTIFTDTLFQTKYFMSQRKLPDDLYEYCQEIDGYGDDVLYLYKNISEMPFAIRISEASLFAKGDKFETQNSLFTALTGIQERLIKDVSSEINNNQFQMNVGDGKKILYVYGTNSSDSPFSVAVNGVPQYIPASSSTTNQQYPADFGNGMICLGVFQNELATVQFSGSASASDIHLGILDYNMFLNGIIRMRENSPEIKSLKQRNAGVDIELAGAGEGNIFLPISYDKGWSCKVDGERVEELGYVDGMLSVPIAEGSSSLKLRYTAPGRSAGAAVSVVSLIVFAAFVLYDRKRPVSGTQAVRAAGYVAYALFAALFALFLIVIFVIPVMFWLRGIFVASE